MMRRAAGSSGASPQRETAGGQGSGATGSVFGTRAVGGPGTGGRPPEAPERLHSRRIPQGLADRRVAGVRAEEIGNIELRMEQFACMGIGAARMGLCRPFAVAIETDRDRMLQDVAVISGAVIGRVGTMSIGEIERRLVELERTVEDLKARADEGAEASKPWWRLGAGAGRFRDDPVFEEMVRLGAEYRRSLGPEEGEDASDRP